MNKILYRPIAIIGATLGLFIMIELIALGGITWRNLHRINIIKEDISYGHQLQQKIFELYLHQLDNIAHSSPSARHDPKLLNSIIADLEQQYPGAPETLELIEISKRLSNANPGQYRQDLMDTLKLAGGFFNQQIREEKQLLSQVYSDSEWELNFAIIFPAVVFLTLLVLDLRFLRRKILAPLEALKELLSLLADGEPQPIDDQNIEPALQSLFSNYNRLIIRLAELELEHANHRQLLEQEIRNATHTLLEQSRSLARSERLAVVGELAASTAHELRNPLAGIQAALRNIQNECTNPDLSERLQLVANEAYRITQRLNELLSLAKHSPETPKRVDLEIVINELLMLIKYQTADNIVFRLNIQTGIKPLLPETELRQALLNLLINACQELSNAGGTITVNAFVKDSQLVIQVRDTGPGFSEQLLTQGIRPFASTHEQGTGLGLSMVRRFAKSLGGDLTLSNDEQGHACASLTCPV
ncbi:MAG: GHKL domain-containing protein [Gammaproteobacteria bacterium]|jgi:signal transduction histidine kinase|uniref:sensor histidine kinase n=1 Tax=Methylotuvimicrobium sp. TaxID=2822413 RepID=UPI001D2EE889|nr:GHKL domain-containing protein [Gammaproteobacteria bacterium]